MPATLTRKEIGTIAALVGAAIIALGAVSVFNGSGGSKTETATLFVESALPPVIEQFRKDVGRIPTTREGLLALTRAPVGEEAKWHGPYVDPPNVPLDPWGHPYQYRAPAAKSGADYDLWSYGPDGIQSEDDIGNWKK